MINYIDNISFQMDNFPEIFNSYIFPENEIKKDIFQVKGSMYLYFLVSDRISLMSHINDCFGVNLTLDLPASAAIVSFGYENRILGFDDGIVRVFINHPFLDMGYSIVVSHILKNALLEKSYDLFSFVEKPLKQMSELQIRKYCKDYYFETHNLSSYDEILDRIANNRPKYTFQFNAVPKVKRVYLKDAEFADKYSLLLVSLINDSLLKEENEIIQDCVDGIMNSFRIRGKEVIERHLQIAEFNVNFVIIEHYFQFEKKCRQGLNTYFNGKLLSSIKEFKNNCSNHVTLHNMISNDNSILEVDDYMNKEIEKLNNILEAIC